MDDIDFDALRELMRTDIRAAGKILSAIRDGIGAVPGKRTGWTAWLRKNGFRFESTSKCLRAFDPIKWATKKTLPPSVPPTTSNGEIHEAARSFKALMTKAAAEQDMKLADRRRTVAFQHFKFLLGYSNLPALMKMPPDEIIDLLRKI